MVVKQSGYIKFRPEVGDKFYMLYHKNFPKKMPPEFLKEMPKNFARIYLDDDAGDHTHSVGQYHVHTIENGLEIIDGVCLTKLLECIDDPHKISFKSRTTDGHTALMAPDEKCKHCILTYLRHSFSICRYIDCNKKVFVLADTSHEEKAS